MSDISEFLFAFADIDDPGVQANVDEITAQLSSASLRGGVDRATGVIIQPPKPKGGGGLPWLRARMAMSRALEHAQVMTVGLSAADAQGAFASRLESLVGDWLKPAALALTAADGRLMFAGGPTPTDLAFLASEMNTLARFMPAANPLRGTLVTLRNSLATEAKNRLAPEPPPDAQTA